MSKQLLTVALAAVLGLAFGAPIEAATLNQALVPGVVNTIEDQDREAYVDANQNGLFDVGDVFVGFVRLDNFSPSPLATENQVYAVFSNQITAITESPLGSGQVFVSLGVSAVAGLTLQDITGNANTVGGMFAVYDAAVPFSLDLIATSAGNTLKDDIDLIVSEGTLRLVTTVIGANGDFLTVDQAAGFDALPGGSNAGIVGLGGGITVGSFTGGLSVIFNNTVFSYAPTVASVDPLTGLQTSQVAVASGAIRGSADDGQQAVFTNISEYGAFTQCTVGGVNTPCGFITDADFLVAPLAVPLPASLLLLGGGLLGTAAVGTLRRRR